MNLSSFEEQATERAMYLIERGHVPPGTDIHELIEKIKRHMFETRRGDPEAGITNSTKNVYIIRS